MSERTWFFAFEGQQRGPYSEPQLRDLIAKGAVTADTLVWSEGMAGWRKAGEVAELFSAGPVEPPGPPAMAGRMVLPTGTSGEGQPLSAEFGIWALLGRSLLFTIGVVLVIPAPWVATGFYRWCVERLRVPGRPQLGFTGKPGDIWYVFVLQGLCAYAGLSDAWYPPLMVMVLEAFLSWMTIRWIVANISSEGRPPRLSFAGSPWAYMGWYLLLYVSAITIIGWAWVITAWMRWICRNITGTQRDIVFIASGWQVLWRTLLLCLVSVLIIPIPWALAWYVRWNASQFVFVGRSA